jgi:hypothetical protein
MDRTDLLRWVQDDAHRNDLVLGEPLGYGLHGIVLAAKYQTQGGRCALKVHERDKEYRRERDVYLRLREHGITEIRGCHVPEMLALDDECWGQATQKNGVLSPHAEVLARRRYLPQPLWVADVIRPQVTVH